jgi:hypothetical protein
MDGRNERRQDSRRPTEQPHQGLRQNLSEDPDLRVGPESDTPAGDRERAQRASEEQPEQQQGDRLEFALERRAPGGLYRIDGSVSGRSRVA